MTDANATIERDPAQDLCDLTSEIRDGMARCRVQLETFPERQPACDDCPLVMYCDPWSL